MEPEGEVATEIPAVVATTEIPVAIAVVQEELAEPIEEDPEDLFPSTEEAGRTKRKRK